MKIMIQSRLLLLAGALLLPLIHSAICCSPKAVRSVFVGRPAAQAAHQAKKAKYLAGQSKTIGQKLRLSKGGGIIMEQVDPKKLKDEIKYLESIEKSMKVAKKRELKSAAKLAKLQAKGKAPKVPTKGVSAAAGGAQVRPPPMAAASAAVSPFASNAGSASKNIGKRSGLFGKKAGKQMDQMPDPPPLAPPPVAAVAAASTAVGDVGKGAKKAGKKSGGFFGKSKTPKKAEPPPRPPPPAPPPPPPPPVEIAQEAMKKKRRRIFG